MKAFRPDAARIKALRIQQSWPQEQLAQIADVSPRTIQRVEAGGNASYETLRSIASALDVEIRDLLTVQPVVSATGCSQDTVAEDSLWNSQSGLSIARSNSRLKIWSGILLALLLVITSFAGLTHFWWKLPVSGRPEVPGAQQLATAVPNFPQERAGLLVGGERPIGYEGARPSEVKRQVKIRPRTRMNKRLSQQVHQQEINSSSLAPPEGALPNVVLPEHVILPAFVEISDAFRAVPQLAAMPAGEVTAESSITDTQIREAELVTSEGLASRVKHAATGGALSTSDTVRRSSKRMAGFFSRLGATVKKSF